MALKKLLIIPSWQVWPLNSGGANAQTFLLNQLSVALEVHIILSKLNTDIPEEFSSNFPNITIHWLDIYDTEAPTLKEKTKNLIFRITNRILNSKIKKETFENDITKKLAQRIQLLYTIDKPLSDKIKTLDKRYNYDFIQYEMETNIPLILDYLPNGKKIIILHEVTSKIVTQMIDVTNSLKSHYADTILKTIEGYEKNTLKLFNEIVVFNSDDKNYLENKTRHITVTVSPYTVPLNKHYFKPNLKQYNLTFIGSGHHYPNLQGLEWFLSNVFPQVKKLHPKIRIFITGQWQISFQQQYINSKDIVFLGNLPKNDFNELLRSNIMVSPVFIGSGLRTKLMDNLQIGVPTVCSLNEQKSIPELTNNENIMLADTPDEFAEAIDKLLNNNELRMKISENAKKTFTKLFNINSLLAKRLKIYN